MLGIPVDHRVARRLDAPGALVVLEDRRLALTGALAAVGLHRFLRMYVRRRARSKRDQAYRAWLAEVTAVLDGMRPETSAGSIAPASGGPSTQSRSRPATRSPSP